MKNNKFILWLLIGLVLFTFWQNKNQGETGNVYLDESELGVVTKKAEYTQGKEVILTLKNNTEATLEIPMECGEEPFIVNRYENGEWVSKTVKEDAPHCDEPSLLTLEAGESTNVTYKNWAYRLFGELGRYRIDVPLTIGVPPITIADTPQNYISNEFTVNPRGTFGSFWINGIYRPIQNGLVWLIKTVPGNSLGIAIILLTLIIRTALLIPSQKALRSQRKMQEVQQEIDAVKKKYKDNQEKIALETMALWKKHKVNPFGSCLMMFIQFPILIALYYVIWEGLHIDKMDLLYTQVAQGFNFAHMNTQFLGLDLLEINFIVLPLIVGGLQFIQMQIMLAKKKKKAPEPTKKIKKKDTNAAPDMQDQMKMANNMMKYFMPAMIAFFTASLPSGVGIYWGTSTIYGIMQQLVINRTRSDSEGSQPTVKVIEKK